MARELRFPVGIVLAVLVLLLSGGPAMAEDEKGSGEEKIEGRARPELLGEWSIKKEVRTLERSLEKYDPLIQSLTEANEDLKADLDSYVGNDQDQVLASRITLKMSAYAKKIVWDFDRIISTQDVLVDVFKELTRKLGKFSGYLKFKEEEYKIKAVEHKKRGQELAEKLHELSTKYKEADDPKAKEEARREFTKAFREYKINERYVRGYGNNVKEYRALSTNLGTLVRIFDDLQGAFQQLISNLEMEKQFMMDNIRLQADSILVEKTVHEAISEGKLAISTITEKLALLYTQVEGFAKVHERINEGLGRFASSQKILTDVTMKIEQVGGLKAAPDIETAIEYFYSQRYEDAEEPQEEESEAQTEEEGE